MIEQTQHAMAVLTFPFLIHKSQFVLQNYKERASVTKPARENPKFCQRFRRRRVTGFPDISVNMILCCFTSCERNKSAASRTSVISAAELFSRVNLKPTGAQCSHKIQPYITTVLCSALTSGELFMFFCPEL